MKTRVRYYPCVCVVDFVAERGFRVMGNNRIYNYSGQHSLSLSVLCRDRLSFLILEKNYTYTYTLVRAPVTKNYQIKTAHPSDSPPVRYSGDFGRVFFSLYFFGFFFPYPPNPARTIVFYYLFPRIFIRFSSLARAPRAYNCMENRCTLYTYISIYVLICTHMRTYRRWRAENISPLMTKKLIKSNSRYPPRRVLTLEPPKTFIGGGRPRKLHPFFFFYDYYYFPFFSGFYLLAVYTRSVLLLFPDRPSGPASFARSSGARVYGLHVRKTRDRHRCSAICIIVPPIDLTELHVLAEGLGFVHRCVG